MDRPPPINFPYANLPLTTLYYNGQIYSTNGIINFLYGYSFLHKIFLWVPRIQFYFIISKFIRPNAHFGYMAYRRTARFYRRNAPQYVKFTLHFSPIFSLNFLLKSAFQRIKSAFHRVFDFFLVGV